MRTAARVYKRRLGWSISAVLCTATCLPLLAQTWQPNSLNIPDPNTATAVQMATALNSLTPQSIPEQSVLLGVFEMAPGSNRLRWNSSAFTACPSSGSGGLVVLNPPVCLTLNSFNVEYQILITKPANFDLQVELRIPGLNGSDDKTATIQTIPAGAGLFAGGTVASIKFHPSTFRPQTLKFSHAGVQLGCTFANVVNPCSFTINPFLMPQLGAFVVPYLPVAIIYQPPGCGVCHTSQGDIPCGSTASYMQGTKVGTTFSWSTSSTAGTMKEMNSNEFFTELSTAGDIASKVASVIPGGQAASSAFQTMGSVAKIIGGLSNTSTSTTTSVMQGQTQQSGWVVSASEGYATDACQNDDLFVYLKDVVFIYAVVPKDPISGNVTANGVATVILAPYRYLPPVRQGYFSHLQNDLPSAVAAQFRSLSLRANPPDPLRASMGVGREKPRMILRPAEECPSDGSRPVNVEEEQLKSSETSQTTTVTTVTNVTGVMASIFQVNPSTNVITTGGGAGQTTNSLSYSSAVTNWSSVSQDAGLELKCPEVAPAQGREMDIYFDSLFDTLIAIPGPLLTNQPPIVGTVANQQGQPASAQPVTLKIGDKTYRVRSNANGQFAFPFASIPRGQGTIVTGAETKAINYAGTPVSNLNFRVGTATPATPILGAVNATSTSSGDGLRRVSTTSAASACCEITTIGSDGIISARVISSGQEFQFKVADAKMLGTLRAGQSVYANLTTHQVSVDGKRACCAIVNIGNTKSGAMTVQSSQTSQQPQNAGSQNKGKSGSQKPTDAGKDTFGLGNTTVQPGPEPTTEHAIRAAAPRNPQSASGGPITAVHVPELSFRPGTTTNGPTVNPNHLPNLAPGVSGGSAECTYNPPQTCQQVCSSLVVTTYIGVKNTTEYPVNGTIEVVLQDTSGNPVRQWTVNGLAGNGAAYPGTIRQPFHCVPPGTESMNAVRPNYVLVVKAPAGVTELDTSDNRAEIYIPPSASISQ